MQQFPPFSLVSPSPLSLKSLPVAIIEEYLYGSVKIYFSLPLLPPCFHFWFSLAISAICPPQFCLNLVNLSFYFLQRNVKEKTSQCLGMLHQFFPQRSKIPSFFRGPFNHNNDYSFRTWKLLFDYLHLPSTVDRPTMWVECLFASIVIKISIIHHYSSC